MAVEVTISHVIEKMKYLHATNEIMNLPSLETEVNRFMKILEEFLEFLKKANDSGDNSSEINGWNTEHLKKFLCSPGLKELLYSTEDEIDRFLAKTALAKASPVLYVKSWSNQSILSNKINKILCKLKKMAPQQESSSNPKNMGDGPADSSGNNMVDPQPESKNYFENTFGVEQPDQQKRVPPSSSSKDMGDGPPDSSGNNMVDPQPEIKNGFENTSGVEQPDQQQRVPPSSNPQDMGDGPADLSGNNMVDRQPEIKNGFENTSGVEQPDQQQRVPPSSNPQDMGDGPADLSGNNMVDRQPEIKNGFEYTSGIEQPDQQQGVQPSSSSKDMGDGPADSSGNNMVDPQPEIKNGFENTSGVEQPDQQRRVPPSSSSKDMGDGLADSSGNNMVDPQSEIKNGFENTSGVEHPDQQQGVPRSSSAKDMGDGPADSSGNNMVDPQPEIKNGFENTSGVEQPDQQQGVPRSSSAKDMGDGPPDSSGNNMVDPQPEIKNGFENTSGVEQLDQQQGVPRSSSSKDMADGPADSSGNNMVDLQPAIKNGFENTSGVEQPDQQQRVPPSSSSKDMGDGLADSSGNNMVDPQPEIKNGFENTSGVEQPDQQQRVPPSSNPKDMGDGPADSSGKDLVDGASDPNMTTDLSNREIVQMEIPKEKAEAGNQSQRLRRSIGKVVAVNRCVTYEKEIVGMEDKIKELAQLTLNRYTTYFPISVVGRAGSGKTLLVRQIFNQSQRRRDFDKFAFVSISQNFKERDVMAEILQQVAGVKDHNESSSEELKKKLGFFLSRKRYLIVLDDVHKADVWNKLKLVFQNPLKGSRVILTIRDVNVARHIAPTVVLLHLRPLTHGESWQLFLKRLTNYEHDCSADLKKQILKNCEGLPLQILVLGGLLAHKKAGKWSNVLKQIEIRKKENMRLENAKRKTKVSSQDSEGTADSAGLMTSVIFDLGFQELDSPLKACFYYLCLFPKSSKVRTRKLFRLWVAEGLVRLTPGDKSIEAVVDEYLENLESRNMIEVVELRSDGMPKTCQMPTALYDKFISNALKELGYHHVAGKLESTSNSSEINICKLYSSDINIRKLSVFSDVQDRLDSRNIEKVRSYICFDKQKGDKPAEEVGNFIKKILVERGFGLMTVLDLEGVYKPQLPKTLGKVLPLLKFVGLRGTFLDSIPDSIGDLPFLETLDVKRTNIPRLPISIWSAQELQHLYMNENHFEYSNPESSSICCPSSYPSPGHYPSNLQTLCGLVIGNNNPPIEWLKKLTGLRKLGLTCHTDSLREIIKWIVGVPNSELQRLKLRAINEGFEPSDIDYLGSMNRLQKLTNLHLLGKLPKGIKKDQLPPNIKILTLSVSELSNDPMELLGGLKELKVLKLLARSYIGQNMTCPKDGFRNLQVLNLWMLTELKQWTILPGAMPKLTRLEIRLCRKLSKPDGLKNLTSLKQVTLTNMKEDFVKKVKNCLCQDISIDNRNYSFDPSWDARGLE